MRTRLILLFTFVLAVGSGFILGLAWGRHQPTEGSTQSPPPVVAATEPSPDAGNEPQRGGRVSLRTALNLTAEQQEKMRAIWEPLAPPRGGPGERGRGPGTQPDARRDLQSKRDASIQAMLSPEQRETYKQIQEDFREQLDAMDHERRKRFDDAVEQTKAILTPEQRTKYEEILRNRGGRPGPSGFRPSPATGGGTRP